MYFGYWNQPNSIYILKEIKYTIGHRIKRIRYIIYILKCTSYGI